MIYLCQKIEPNETMGGYECLFIPQEPGTDVRELVIVANSLPTYIEGQTYEITVCAEVRKQ